MHTVLYYFSATGNSLYAAKVLAESLGDSRLAAMSAGQQERRIVPAAARVGLVFPLHYFGVPPLVRQFVERLELAEAKYVFAVVTCGAPTWSSALSDVGQILHERGGELAAGFRVGMISNYIALSALPPQAKRAEKLGGAQAKLQRIGEMIAASARQVEPEYFRWPCAAVNHWWLGRVAEADRRFSAAPSCTGCGLCEQVCPVGNIKLQTRRPVWRHGCLECLACLHICPVRSIEFGSRTPGRERYRHPGVTAEELLQPEKL